VARAANGYPKRRIIQMDATANFVMYVTRLLSTSFKPRLTNGIVFHILQAKRFIFYKPPF
jgi:hypothetical protein